MASRVNQAVYSADAMWPLLVRNSRGSSADIAEMRDPDENIYLPCDYIVPGGLFDTMFYWDSFFIMVGVRHSSRYRHLLRPIVDNCVYMIETYGRVLNSNKKQWSSRSQLPFLTSMIEIARSLDPPDDWIDRAYRAAITEYEEYWTAGTHLLDNGLSRFFEDTGGNYMTRHTEASWDMSPRYTDQNTTNLAPVDLNANLYRYELDIAAHLNAVGCASEAQAFKERSRRRRETMLRTMWCPADGLFYDFDVTLDTQTDVRSLAAFVPLWAGLTDAAMAEQLVSNLHRFETDHGLVTCDHDYGYDDRQWNYPMGWAPLHWMVHGGLRSFGYTAEASRIAGKWTNLVAEVFDQTGAFWEKYDVVTGAPATMIDRYAPQVGFGWTNGVLIDLTQVGN